MSKELVGLIEFPKGNSQSDDLVGYGLVYLEEDILRFRLKRLSSSLDLSTVSDESVVELFENSPLHFVVDYERFVRYIQANSPDILEDKFFRALYTVLKQAYQLGYPLDFSRLALVLEEKVMFDQWKVILRSLSKGDSTFEKWGVAYG
jgi:hypothetical protein